MEEMIYKDGQLLNPNLVDYRVPSFNHLPKDFETILVESHNGPGPFGAKGTGEGGLLPVAAAIGNAVCRATGLRMYDLAADAGESLARLGGASGNDRLPDAIM